MHDLLNDIKSNNGIVLDPKILSSNWVNGTIVKSSFSKINVDEQG